MRTKIALLILIVVVVLGGVGFTALSLEIFDRINTVDALCFRRPGEENYTPDNFARENFDTVPYLITTYETVEFPARGDGVTVSGFFIPATISDTSTSKAQSSLRMDLTTANVVRFP